MGLRQERVSNVLESSHNLMKENIKTGAYMLLKHRESKKASLHKKNMLLQRTLVPAKKIFRLNWNYGLRQGEGAQAQTLARCFLCKQLLSSDSQFTKTCFSATEKPEFTGDQGSFLFHLNDFVNGRTEIVSSPIQKARGKTKLISDVSREGKTEIPTPGTATN